MVCYVIFRLTETICPKIWAKPLSKNAKRLLPALQYQEGNYCVDKTTFLKRSAGAQIALNPEVS